MASDVLEPDLSFDLVESGINGNSEIVPKIDRTNEKIHLPLKTVPFGLPPILPSIEDELEKFLTSPESLPIHDVDRAQKFMPRVPEPLNLLHTDVCPVQSTIQVERDPTTGKLLGYTEELCGGLGKTAQNSLSLKRAPDPSTTNNVKGSTLNFPFWPGGQDEPEIDELLISTETENFNFELDLLEVAPGLAEGMKFDSQEEKSQNALKQTDSSQEQPKVMTLADIMTLNDDREEFNLGDEEEEEKSSEENKPLCNRTVWGAHLSIYQNHRSADHKYRICPE